MAGWRHLVVVLPGIGGSVLAWRGHRVSSGCKNAPAFHVDVNFPQISQGDQGIRTPVQRNV